MLETYNHPLLNKMYKGDHSTRLYLENWIRTKNDLIGEFESEKAKINKSQYKLVKLAVNIIQREWEISNFLVEFGRNEDAVINLMSMTSFAEFIQDYPLAVEILDLAEKHTKIDKTLEHIKFWKYAIKVTRNLSCE